MLMMDEWIVGDSFLAACVRGVQSSKFNVRCSMFDVLIATPAAPNPPVAPERPGAAPTRFVTY